MTLQTLQEASYKVTGFNEVKRTIAKGKAAKVYIATDADNQITDFLKTMCEERQLAFEKVPSMIELGKVAGVDVAASAACIVNCEN